jgi:hypothetical protein
MLELLAGAGLFVALFFVARRLFSKKVVAPVQTVSPQLVNWIHEELGRLLSERLKEEPRDVTASLVGAPDAEIVTKIEEAVQRVELVYERALDQQGFADLRLEVRFENGELDRSIKRIPWSELPAEVAKEFAEGGAAQLYREWRFSWQQG